jgi:hypothetical protein
MSTGWKFGKWVGIVVLCLGCVSAADTTKHQKKTKKPELAPLPSGPTGRPVPQVPLDSMKPVAPQVTYQNGQLTIVAPNSTLGDILRAVKKQTGAEIEIPEATERVVTHLGPGPARDVMAELLNGSRFNYVLLGSPEDSSLLTRVVLVAKTVPDNAKPNQPGQPPVAQARPEPQQEMAQDANDADAQDDNSADDNSEPAQPMPAEAEQPNQSDQNGPKSPQQLLQEMQQRQMQLQQQQPPGQPPIPGQGMPPGAPQQPPQPQ